MKRSSALLSIVLPVALAAAMVLTGCSETNASDQKCAPSGAASDSVKLDGKLGGEVKITSKTPIVSKSLERTVAIHGTGKKLTADTPVTAQLTVFNGKTGTTIAPGAQTIVVNDPEQVTDWVVKAAGCSAIGDRVVVVAPVSTILPPGQGATYQLADSDPLVLVFDFLKEAATRAEGKAKKAPAGFPTVTLDKNGKPTVTMPKSKAPAKLDIATLIQGEGDTVKDGDQVTVHYVGAIWRNGEVFNSSWDGGQPATFTVAYPNGVIEGFYKALVGAKVGSQVIAIVPPSAGYGKNTAENLKGSAKDVKNDDTLVFVVDILATSHTK